MLAFLTSLVLSQAVTPAPSTPPRAAPVAWGAAVEWKEGEVARRAWVSPVLVAEAAPSPEGAAAVRRADASAQVVVERAAMRLWKVQDAARVRAQVPALLEVLHDLKSTGSRARVPVGLLCAGHRVDVKGLAALERVAQSPGCGVDFWSPGYTR